MRPVRFNVHPKEANIAEAISMGTAPDGISGDGFFATQLSSVVGLARKIHYGLCRLQHLVVELNLWQPWHHTMIYQDLDLSVWDFLLVSATY